MLVYAVTKPGGTRDREFDAYTRLLEDVRIDVSDAVRLLGWLFQGGDPHVLGGRCIPLQECRLVCGGAR